MFKNPIILILLLALFLRVINLGQSFWLDEASQAEMSSKSISYIWSGRGGDFHPPFFYFLARFWLGFGKSETWLRFPSAISGVGTVYLVYLFGKKIFSEEKVNVGPLNIKIKYLAAIFAAVNPFLIYYSQEFRSYSLLGFLGTASMYLLYSRSYWKLSLINTLMLYTHYSSVFLILAQIVYVTFHSRTDLLKYLQGLLISIVLYLPWIPQFTKQLHAGVNIDTYLPGWREILSVSPLKALPVILFKLVAGRINFLSRYVYGIYIVFVFAGTFLAFIFAKKSKNFLSVWLLVPVFAVIITSLAFPQNQPFRVIYIAPALCLLFASAIWRFPKLFLSFLIYVSLVGNILYFTRPRLQREQWRQATSFLSSASGRVVVKFPAPFAPMAWYNPSLKVIPAVSSFPARPEQVASNLSPLIGSSENIYLLEYLTGLTDPKRVVDKTLHELGFEVSGTYNYEGVGFIYLYSRPTGKT